MLSGLKNIMWGLSLENILLQFLSLCGLLKKVSSF